MHYVYVLYSAKLNRFYVGSTHNVQRRLEAHNQGRSTFTSRGLPWQLVYYEAYGMREDALERERKLKNHGKGMIELKKRLSFSREQKGEGGVPR